MHTGRPRTSRSSPSPGSGAGRAGRSGLASSPRAVGRARQPRHSQLPSAHADVALSALRDPPGRDGPVLGLPSLQHRLRVMPELPQVRRRPGRLLRIRSGAAATSGRRDPRLLGGPDRDSRGSGGRHPTQCAATRRLHGRPNARSSARIRRGRFGGRRRAPAAVAKGGLRHGDGFGRGRRRRGSGALDPIRPRVPRNALEPVGGRRQLRVCGPQADRGRADPATRDGPARASTAGRRTRPGLSPASRHPRAEDTR